MSHASHRACLTAAMLSAICLCVACKRPAAHGVPNIDGLKDALQKSAETALPAPTITSGKITLRVAADKLEAEVERIIKLATALGGTALRSTGSEAAANLLVRIPGQKGDDFRAQATGRPVPPAASVPEENQLIEVVINPFK